ncbi:threonine/serine dehydratase [Spirillospora sp. NPDC052269]
MTIDEPRLVTAADIAAAATRIGRFVRHPALIPADVDRPGGPLWIKPENLQPTKAFKVRGAVNAVTLLAEGGRTTHVVAHSSGNHAQAVAFAARRHGLRATVVLPDTAPPLKVEAARAQGAEVIVVPPADREATALALAATDGAVLVSSDDPAVIAGHGTIGAEIARDLPDARVVLAPVCNGGLLAGVAVALKAADPSIRVVGVEPALAADAAESLRLGRRTRWPVESTYRTMADGLRAPVLGPTAWPHIRALVDDIVTVEEEDIAEAMSVLWQTTGQVAEPSGAVAAAAYLFRRDALPAGTAVAILSGGTVAGPPVAAKQSARHDVAGAGSL